MSKFVKCRDIRSDGVLYLSIESVEKILWDEIKETASGVVTFSGDCYECESVIPGRPAKFSNCIVEY